MNAVIEKLADIEATAQNIVARAQEEKGQIEKELQYKRDEFDRRLEEETEGKIAAIRQENEEKVNRLLEEQREKNSSTIRALEQDFEKNHSLYAEKILKHIIEV